MNFKNLLSGALVVTGLVTACGGEVQESNDSRGDTGLIKSGIVTAYEDVPCDPNKPIYYYNPAPYTLYACTLSQDFTHSYNTNYSVVAKAGTSMIINANGTWDYATLSGNQSLYVGTPNGFVSFLDNTTAHFTKTDLSTGRATRGVLAADQCLTKPDGTKLVCKGGTDVQFDSAGYLYAPACVVVSSC